MNIDNKNKSVNHQDYPREEGQQNNTPPIKENDGQRNSDNHNQSMSNMMRENKDQKDGRNNEEKSDRSI